jgi:hypothetical protein
MCERGVVEFFGGKGLRGSYLFGRESVALFRGTVWDLLKDGKGVRRLLRKLEFLVGLGRTHVD